MFKSFFMALALLVGTHAQASVEQITALNIAQSVVVKSADAISFTVGDNADYKINGGIIQGTMHAQVREQVSEGFWIQQDMKLGFLGDQKVEILIDPSTGQTKELLVNGEKQTPPNPEDFSVTEMKADHITVPAGSFDCAYMKVHDNKQNKDSDNWVNPSIVPIAGTIKTIAPGPMGNMTVELTAYKKQ